VNFVDFVTFNPFCNKALWAITEGSMMICVVVLPSVFTSVVYLLIYIQFHVGEIHRLEE